jgi:hypothetical protein
LFNEKKLVAVITPLEFKPDQDTCIPSKTTTANTTTPSPAMTPPASAGGSSPAPATAKNGTANGSGGSLMTQWGPAGLWRTAALASVLAVVFWKGLGMASAA